jgi:hypothetical protein
MVLGKGVLEHCGELTGCFSHTVEVIKRQGERSCYLVVAQRVWVQSIVPGRACVKLTCNQLVSNILACTWRLFGAASHC